MALPTSRNETYAANSKVKAVTLNDIQDCIIGDKMAANYEWVGPRGFAEVNITNDNVNGNVYANPGAATIAQVPLQLAVGRRVTDIAARVLGTGAGGNVVVRLRRYNGDGTSTVMGTLTINTPPAAWATYTLVITPFTVESAKPCYFEADLPTTNQKISGFGFNRDKL